MRKIQAALIVVFSIFFLSSICHANPNNDEQKVKSEQENSAENKDHNNKQIKSTDLYGNPVKSTDIHGNPIKSTTLENEKEKPKKDKSEWNQNGVILTPDGKPGGVILTPDGKPGGVILAPDGKNNK